MLLGLCYGCGPSGDPLFTSVRGIDFANTIPENDPVKIVLFDYIYNGGGVGVGDFDQDATPDLVFGGAAGQPVTIWKQNDQPTNLSI